MIDVKVNQQAYNRIIKTIDKMASRIDNLEPILSKFADYYVTEHIEKGGFEARGKGFGARWDTYNPSYLKWKQRHHSGKPMLFLSGQLKLDATKNIEKKIEKKRMFLIINNPLATIHQFNKKKPRPFALKLDGTLPTRAITWLMEEMFKFIKGDWK